IQIATDLELESIATHGYFEYIFTITNKAKQSHKVTLTLPAEVGRSYGDHFRAISRSVEVAPESTLRVSLYQPVSPPLGGTDVAVRIDDKLQSRTLPLNSRRDGRKPDRSISVLVLAPGKEQFEFGGVRIPGEFVRNEVPGVEFLLSDTPLRDAATN